MRADDHRTTRPVASTPLDAPTNIAPSRSSSVNRNGSRIVDRMEPRNRSSSSRRLIWAFIFERLFASGTLSVAPGILSGPYSSHSSRIRRSTARQAASAASIDRESMPGEACGTNVSCQRLQRSSRWEPGYIRAKSRTCRKPRTWLVLTFSERLISWFCMRLTGPPVQVLPHLSTSQPCLSRWPPGNVSSATLTG